MVFLASLAKTDEELSCHTETGPTSREQVYGRERAGFWVICKSCGGVLAFALWAGIQGSRIPQVHWQASGGHF